MILPLLIVGAVVGLVVYEKTKGSLHKGKAPAAPALPSGNPLPPGVSWKGLTQVAPPPSPTPGFIHWGGLKYVPPPSPADNVNDASQIAGLTKSLLAESSNPALGMFPQHLFVLEMLRGLINNPTMQNLDVTIDHLRSGAGGQEGIDRGNALSELRGHLTAIHTVHVGGPTRPFEGDAGNAYEDYLTGGSSPPPQMIPATELPRIVMHLCAVVLAQATEGQGSSLPKAPAPPAPPHAGGSAPLLRGHAYFVAWPSGGPPLRKDLWELSRVTDSAMGPAVHFAADPQKEPLPLRSVPPSAPPAWLSSYGKGKAIAVLTWTGPEGSSDPAVEILGEYTPTRAAA